MTGSLSLEDTIATVLDGDSKRYEHNRFVASVVADAVRQWLRAAGAVPAASSTESHYWCTHHEMPHRDSNLSMFKDCTLVGPYATREEAVEWAADVVPAEPATPGTPTPLDMVTELHEAVYGESWARPESPQAVWEMLLGKVRGLASGWCGECIRREAAIKAAVAGEASAT